MHRLGPIQLCALVVALAAVGAAPARAATTRALLVGVSGYPGLPPPESPSTPRQLVGPRNDVVLMSEVLDRRGVPRAQQWILADGVGGADGAPTRAAIEAGVGKLLAVSAPGDVAILYFSGHGSREPAPVSTAHPDGYRELFLPIDVGRWSGAAQTVGNAVSDDQFTAWRDAFGARGVAVWALFDTCHAGTMFRGAAAEPDSTETSRYLQPAMLGVPALAARPAAAPGRAEPRPTAGSWVAFYASRSDESAPELDLPVGGANRVRHGLFTYTIAEALTARPVSTYRDLRQRVLYRYAALGRLAPNPDADGDLDRGPALTQPREARGLDRFIVRREGVRWRLEAGRLNGIDMESTLALALEGPGGESEAVAIGRVTTLGNVSSLVSLEAVPGRAPECPAPAAGGPVRLRTAEVLWASPCRRAARLATLRECASEPHALAELRRCPAASPRSLEALPALVRARFDAGEATPRGEPALTAALAPSGLVLFATHALPGGTLPPPTRLNPDAADAAAVIARSERKALLIERLAGLAAGAFGMPAGVDVEVRAGRARESGRCAAPLPRLTSEVPATLATGAAVGIRVENHADHPTDVLVFAIGPEGDAAVLYPEQATENNRLPAGGVVSLCARLDGSGPPGSNWLFAIASPARRPLTPRLDLESLYPAALRDAEAPRVRAVKAAAAIDEAGVEVFRWTEVR